jgi:hypothetical protein
MIRLDEHDDGVLCLIPCFGTTSEARIVELALDLDHHHNPDSHNLSVFKQTR